MCPSPRDSDSNLSACRAMRRSLRQEGDASPGMFHLKHGGITLAASQVKKTTEGGPGGLDVFEMTFPPGYGIVDGRRSYEMFQDAQRGEYAPEGEYVKLEIITGANQGALIETVSEARGSNLRSYSSPYVALSTSESSNWLKDELDLHGLADQVAWNEGEDGEVGMEDVLTILSCLNIAAFPDRYHHPLDVRIWKCSWLSSGLSLNRYERLLRPVVRDVLYLHDLIALQGAGHTRKRKPT